MVSKLAELVSGDQLVAWMIFMFLVGYFLYKEWPEFKRRVSSGEVKERIDADVIKTVDMRLGAIEKNIKEIDQKLDRDYQRINNLERSAGKTEKKQSNITEELSLIIDALLGALGGLQELGANGPTKEAEKKITDYMNRKMHVGKEE